MTTKIAMLCDGLIYISETDAPVIPFVGARAGAVSAETIASQGRFSFDAPIEEKDAHAFFGILTKSESWHSATDRERAKKFLELETLLEENLRDLKVFKIGRVRLDIYAVGIDAGGDLVGIKTQAVET